MKHLKSPSFLRPLVSSAFCGAALLCAAPKLAHAQAPQPVIAPPPISVPLPPFEGIVVSGMGEVRLRPDIARLNVGVQTQDKDPQRAAQLNATRTQAVLAALLKAGVAKDDIQTSTFSITPQYDYRPRPNAGANEPQQPVLTGYQVNNEVRVVVRRLESAGSVLDAAIQAGANTAGGISFDLDDRTKARDEALRRAAQDAARKARVLLEANSTNGPIQVVTPLRLVALVENGADSGPRPMVAFARAEAASNTTIASGEIVVSANVTAYYSTGGR